MAGVDGFTTERVSTESVAEKLRRVREEHGMTIEGVVDRIRIQKKYVIALENASYEELPADVYTRGFLRSYAQIVGLDPDALVAQFVKERSVDRKLHVPVSERRVGRRSPSFVSFFPLPRFSSRPVITPRLLLIVSVVCAFVGVLGYLFYQIGSFAAAPTVILERPDRDVTIDSTTMTVIGSTEANVDVVVNGQEVFVDGDGRFSTSVTLQEGLNEILVIGRNRVGKETRVLRNVVVEH